MPLAWWAELRPAARSGTSRCYGFGKSPTLGAAQVDRCRPSKDTSKGHHKTDDAERQSAEAQCNDPDIPQRPLRVPEREIETVKAVVDPALEALTAGELRDEPARCDVDVRPRAILVGELHAHHRERSL